MQSWSIIIFGFNEEKTVGEVITSAYKMLQKISSDCEIIVVDDGSTDASRIVISDLQKNIPCLKPIFHPTNQGIGAALISGYRAAEFENVCAIPADGQFNISQLENYSLVEPHNIISFFREKNEIYSPFRKFLTWSNKQILRYIFKVSIKDINWVKIYKRQDINTIPFEMSSSLVESEICIKLIRNGVLLIETPTIYLPRNFGTPKGASLKIMTKAILELPDLYFAVKRFLKTQKNIS